MFIWKCKNCGAPLELEDDVAQTCCSYCGVTSRVSPPQVPVARPAAPPGAERRVLVMVAVFAGALATGVAAFALVGSPPAADPSATERANVDETRLARSAVEHAHALVVQRVKQLMVSNNCTPLVEATDLRGPYDLVNTLQGAERSPCVTLVGESGAPGNGLKLWLNEPGGAAIPTPEVGRSLHMRYCAKTTGSHPARIVPQTDEVYTLAVLECPR